ncbi:DUF6777 domain-containing protein [Actinomadura roseirufa]|uniref:DUF6777 domain-containing protein n=1 Tax=Actinomadura roseirufa TaxID=2094049 RepID=UPI00104148BE|nr:DUF6777 domain-containing protein [Actinomadura roseirufa]
MARRRIPARPAALSLAVLCAAAGVLTGCGDAGATITRLTVGTPGPDPYRLVSNTDELKVAGRPRKGGTREGDSPGLYGGTRRASSCDQRKLVEFLQANPAKAQAWARVQGIPVGEIARYVSRLTPVLLRADTLVTNHGYRDGRATSEAAVLQAGMGVLVNGFGVPAVKCNCGNPLTRPEKEISTRGASYTGRSWPGFTKKNVTKVSPRASWKGTIGTFVLVDPEGTIGFERPRATDGESDGPPEPLPPTEAPVTAGSPTPDISDSGSPGTGGPTDEPGDSSSPTPSAGPTDSGEPTDGPTDVPSGGEGTGGESSPPTEPGGGADPVVSMPPSETPGTPGLPGTPVT